MELIFTKEVSYLKQWDAFINRSSFANHLQLSEWLQSYRGYGFDYEVCLLMDNGIIKAGYGAVIPKFSFFKFYIVPNGPIIGSSACSEIVETIISAISKRAVELKCCYCQFNFPLAIDEEIEKFDLKSSVRNFKLGSLFKYVYVSEGVNWLKFPQHSSEEVIIENFKSSVRRDIRSSERKGQMIAYLKNESDIHAAYRLCEENAKRAGYHLRNWSDFRLTVLNLIKGDRAKFIASYKDNDMKGAIFLVKSGNYYTYIFGGAKRESPDLLTGHFLQWEAIKMSLKENCLGYNISLGGSEGVKSFKSGFNTAPILVHDAKYYLVLNRFTFNLFLFFEKKIKPYKATIAKFLSGKNTKNEN